MTKDNEGQEAAFARPYSNDELWDGRAMGDRVQEREAEIGLSKRDYACIHLKVPKTGKPWLDELITESLRNEMAGREI